MLALSHGVSFLQDFLLGREYDRLSMPSLMFQPHARMALVCGVLMLGVAVAGLFPTVGRGTAFAVLMILLKLLADAISHGLAHPGSRSTG
jgi:hypothetical protein